MARPLHGTKAKLRVNVMLDPDLIASLDSERGPISRSAYIASLIDARANRPTAPISETTAHRIAALGKKQQVTDLRAALDAKICAHPRASRIVTSMGYATCGNCNTRLS